MSFYCFSQIKTGVKDGVTYICPTIENFMLMSRYQERDFDALMNKYHYSIIDESAKIRAYCASLDNFIVHAVVNFDYKFGGGINVWIPKTQMYPQTAIRDLYQKLRPHYQKTENDIEFFAFNYGNRAYGVTVSKTEEQYIISIIPFNVPDDRISEMK